MKREEMIGVIERFFQTMNDHDVDKMAEFCTQGIVADEVAEHKPLTGMGAFKKAYSDVFGGYPDCTAEVEETFVDGNAVICQVRWKATNRGVFRGVEPTGKPVDLRIAYFFRFKGGKIDKITEYYDLATLLVQQGQLEL
ncbi:MAG: ester cyclase [Pseudomonadota bacterium]